MAAWLSIIGLLATLSLLSGCASNSFHPYTYTGAALGERRRRPRRCGH